MLQKLVTFLLFVFGFIFSQLIFAQKIEKKHINYAYGLSNSQITAIKQDSLGYIWIGTQGGGVYKWDGRDLQPLHDSLKYEIIRDVLPTSNGIWVLSMAKIHKIDQNNNIISHSESLNSRLEVSHINNDDHFLRIFRISQNRYVLFSFSGKLLLINDTGEILDEKNLNKWRLKATEFNDSIYFYSNNYLAIVSVKSNEIFLKIKETVFTDFISETPDKRTKIQFEEGKWWIQQEDKILVLDKNFKAIRDLKLPFNNHIFQLKQWQGYYWLATEDGLFQTKNSENELRIVKKELPTNVYHLTNTKEGLWAGTLNGIFHFTNPNLHLIEGTSNENINGYFAYEIVDDKLWAGSYNEGIDIYYGEKLIENIHFEVENMNEVRALLQDGDSLWLGTSAGLFKIHKQTHHYRKQEEVKSRIISLAKTKDGIAVGTTSEGFWILNNGIYEKFGNGRGLGDPTVWAIESTKHGLFVGTEKGLYRLRNDSVNKFNIHKTVDFAPVTAIEKINDSIISIGFAQFGVYIYNLTSQHVVHHYHDKNGLSSSYIYFLKFINGKLWTGSSLGIDVADVFAPFNTFQLQDVNKLGGAETFLNGIVQYENKVIASTIAGTLVIPDFAKVLQSDTEDNFNPIIIEKMEPLSFSAEDDFLNLKQDGEPIQIPFGHGSIKFHFNVAHYGNEKLKFIYELEGYDEEASTPSEEKFAIYKQLAAGDYIFKVWRSLSNEKVGEPAKLAFIVVTPFFRSIWFRTLLFIFLLAVVVLYFMWRARAKTAKAIEILKVRDKAQEELRQEMAIDFHDEMGNHLAKIINLSGVLKMWGLQNEQEKVVNKIENAANSLFTSTKNLIWSLRKENNNLEEVYFHTKDFAENLLDKTNINFRAHKNTNAVHINLNPKAARDLSLIIKEAITNVYKHAKAENVNLNFEILSGKQALISISDDGCGCLELNKKNGNGLKNMKQRALRSNFLFDINASKESGFEIEIRINQHKAQTHV